MATGDKVKETVQGAAPAGNTGQATIDLVKPTEQTAVTLEAKTPEWVAELFEFNNAVIASNKALIESNSALAESIESFKESANEIISNIGERVQAASEQSDKGTIEVRFDPDEDYEVAAGKSFRDPKDFTHEYKEGDNVNHLGEEVLTRLLIQGLIEEA